MAGEDVAPSREAALTSRKTRTLGSMIWSCRLMTAAWSAVWTACRLGAGQPVEALQADAHEGSWHARAHTLCRAPNMRQEEVVAITFAQDKLRRPPSINSAKERYLFQRARWEPARAARARATGDCKAGEAGTGWRSSLRDR